MLTKFELDEAKQLKQEIERSTQFFIFNPNIQSQMKRLEELQSRCEHSYVNGVCIYCGKEMRDNG